MIGINVGLVLQMIKHGVFENKLVQYSVITAITVLAVAIGIFGAKSLLECIIYAQPMLVRMITNAPAFVTDTIVIVLSVPLCELLAKNKAISRYMTKVELNLQ